MTKLIEYIKSLMKKEPIARDVYFYDEEFSAIANSLGDRIYDYNPYLILAKREYEK